MSKTKEEIRAKAQEIHGTMTLSEKKGVRFGVFPQMKLSALRYQGFSQGEEVNVALTLVEIISEEELSPGDPFVKQ